MAGSRAGKTIWAAAEVLRRIYDWDAVRRADKSQTLRYWVVDPIYENGDVARRILTWLAGPLYVDYKQVHKRLVLAGNVELFFKSTERPFSLTSERLNGAWLNETARIKPEAWLGGLQQRLAEDVGWVVADTTPLGMNWFFQYFVKPYRDGEDDYVVTQWHTADNPYIPRESIERARRELPPAYFRREYEGSPEAFIGQVFPEFSYDIHVVDWVPDKSEIIEPGYGVDWGFRDPGVIQAIPKIKHQGDVVYYVAEEQGHQGLTIDDWIVKAKAMRDRHGNGAFYCDPSMPSAIQSFRRAGLVAKAANNELGAGIFNLAKALHPIRDGAGEWHAGVYIHRSCRNTAEQLIGWRYKDTGSGEVPEQKNDHFIDPLRYRVHTKPHNAYRN